MVPTGEGGGEPGEPDPVGIYLTTPDGLTLVADNSTVAPDSDGRRFAEFSRPSLDAGQVAFDARVGTLFVHTLGVFTTGSLVKVAAAGTPIAGGGTLGGGIFSSVTRDGGGVVFIAERDFAQLGVFRSGAGGVAPVVETGDPIPLAPEGQAFATFGPAVAQGGLVAFVGRDALQEHVGVYLADATGISRVADVASLLPAGGGDPFGEFGPVSLDGGALAFIATRRFGEGDGDMALYTTLGGGLSRVVGSGDALDGKTVATVSLGPEGLSCASIGFAVLFTDLSTGIYRADLDGPDPCGAPRELRAARAARLWLTLADATEALARLDVRVELRRNGALVTAGEQRCLGGLAVAQEVEVPLASFDPVALEPGDELGLVVLARIGTAANGLRCRPLLSPRTSAGLRLLYQADDHRSRVRLRIAPDAAEAHFLYSDGRRCAAGPDPAAALFELRLRAPTAAQPRCRDSGPLAFGGGNPWMEIGTWTMSP
jgi:hypothetical protein